MKYFARYSHRKGKLIEAVRQSYEVLIPQEQKTRQKIQMLILKFSCYLVCLVRDPLFNRMSLCKYRKNFVKWSCLSEILLECSWLGQTGSKDISNACLLVFVIFSSCEHPKFYYQTIHYWQHISFTNSC